MVLVVLVAIWLYSPSMSSRFAVKRNSELAHLGSLSCKILDHVAKQIIPQCKLHASALMLMSGTYKPWIDDGIFPKQVISSVAHIYICAPDILQSYMYDKIYQYSRTRRWRKFQKVKYIYKSKEHVPIESFVTTLIDWTFVLMTPTKWASVEVMCSDEVMWLVLRWPVVS